MNEQRNITSSSWRLPTLRISLLMASVMAACTCNAGGISQCSANSIPIQIMDATKIGPETALSAAKISGTPPFRAFVKAITEHVAARLAKDKLCVYSTENKKRCLFQSVDWLCIDSADSKKRSLLQFVDWPLGTQKNERLAYEPSLDAASPSGCQLQSPWIDLVLERKPVPLIRGVIRWNKRQLLVDQAMLEGARNLPRGVAKPFAYDEYVSARREYEDSEMKRWPPDPPIQHHSPPELLWLFERSVLTDLVSFSSTIGRSMNNAMEMNAERYTELVTALIDRCFTSDGADLRYNSILEVADLISLEQYKIRGHLRGKPTYQTEEALRKELDQASRK